jgi:hypothetical protein
MRAGADESGKDDYDAADAQPAPDQAHSPAVLDIVAGPLVV